MQRKRQALQARWARQNSVWSSFAPISASPNSPEFGDGADSTTMSLANLESNAPKGTEGDIKQRFIGHVAFQQQLDGDIEWNK
jgi:hypothetical protein